MTRWYLDTEFNENGRTIELISIALVSETGHEYYAHAEGYEPESCNEWVKENVLPFVKDMPRVLRHQIAAEIRVMLLGNTEASSKPELWAYFADYDWVVFCQLFGRMIDLPKGMPMYCRDLKQLMDERGIKKEQLPPQVNNHDALADAKWVRDAHKALLNWKATR